VTDRGEKSRLGDESPEREEEVRRSIARPTGKKRERRDLGKKVQECCEERRKREGERVGH
jgi:hypothetical protein